MRNVIPVLFLFLLISVCFGEDNLTYGVVRPLPMSMMKAEKASRFERELNRIQKLLPAVNVVAILLDRQNSQRQDWVAILDACNKKGIQAIVAFAKYDSNRNEVLYRPVFENNDWNWDSLGEFVSDPECVNHPALYGLLTVDEPWHQTKMPHYSGDDLKSMYADLKALAPSGSKFNIIVQFSRQLWKQIHELENPNTYYDAGMCDIVAISALEFQDFEYQQDLLDENHFWSRKIIHDKTPNIPLWTSVQTMGRRYGPARGYWFPRERNGFHDLTTLLDDVTSPKYENKHPLTGIMFQSWDSDSAAGRRYQFTLGDRNRTGPEISQKVAARDARKAIEEWIEDR
ncbi:hypothetical protein L0222_12495 [bacterium]|nr:hypothetical protein [bacterium]